MKVQVKLLVAGIALLLAVPAAAQEKEKDVAVAERVQRLERMVESQGYALQVAEKNLKDIQFRQLAEGSMQMEKVRFGTPDGMIIPAYIFKPLQLKGAKQHPALLWIHGGVHGDLDLFYLDFMKPLVAQGYIIIAPEYRGSTGYGREHYEAIDYGGKEVEDCIAARDFLVDFVPEVNPQRIGIIGWSHGGFITLHAIFRQPEKFRAAVEVVGVADLVTRMGYKTDNYRRTFAEQKGFGGPADKKLEVYLERSPYTQASKLQIPLLIHAADNDDDVNIIETRRLIDALKAAGKTFEYEIYASPPGGHMFNRIQSKQSQDSWQKILAFLAKNLQR
jgi:dipeptidyl aminopeptidase/acylaminoacyl peptidase